MWFKIKLAVMLVHDWFIKSVGTLLMWLGLLGLVLNYNYDRMVGRGSQHYGWSWLQWTAFVGCWFLIYWGWWTRRFFKTLDKDIKEEE